MSQEPEYTPAPVPSGRAPSARAGSDQDHAIAVIVVLSAVLAGIALLGMIGSTFSTVFGGGPLSEATDGWTPARERYLDFPLYGSPLVTAVTVIGAILTRRSRGWWALWFVAGFILVLLFIAIGVAAMRGAPPAE